MYIYTSSRTASKMSITGGDFAVCRLFNKPLHLTLLERYCLFVCLCFTSLQQRGHLETAHPFTVPCEGHEAR